MTDGIAIETESQQFPGVIVSPEQLTSARHLAKLDQDDLARRAGIGLSTYKKIEAGRWESVRHIKDQLKRLEKALADAGVATTPPHKGADEGVVKIKVQR